MKNIIISIVHQIIFFLLFPFCYLTSLLILIGMGIAGAIHNRDIKVLGVMIEGWLVSLKWGLIAIRTNFKYDGNEDFTEAMNRDYYKWIHKYM